MRRPAEKKKKKGKEKSMWNTQQYIPIKNPGGAGSHCFLQFLLLRGCITKVIWMMLERKRGKVK